ncbi:hypothetical protein K435DRAFT_661055 [Dendrothele bispora CBS 962.96]|uniref:Isochorismatase-like domain-containing protein n=1 Tax=Dendrothele bispora (strain CBS 962.96) TaxID=1314807 RepID=A0A4S8M936_DENBC|nr:hypothetical protein K435DRAFT_661055 [Dendrothele bispora CBS 962.96]
MQSPTSHLNGSLSSSSSTTATLSSSSNTPSVIASRHVLLLLNTQVAMLSDPPQGIPCSSSVRTNIALILSLARSALNPPLIIHVRNTGEVGEMDEPHTPGWELFFEPTEKEVVVDNLKNNAFVGTELGKYVRSDAEIVVVGTLSDFGVRATCSAALSRGNEVILIRGAHGTFDRVEVLYGGGITPAANIQTEIEDELEEAGVHVLEMKDVAGLFTDR